MSSRFPLILIGSIMELFQGERLKASRPRPSAAVLVGSAPGVRGAGTQADGNDALACTLLIQQQCNVPAAAIYQLAILICGMSLAGFQHRCNIQMG
jgi:hypothetical protein